jgi:hypothetical protein
VRIRIRRGDRAHGYANDWALHLSGRSDTDCAAKTRADLLLSRFSAILHDGMRSLGLAYGVPQDLIAVSAVAWSRLVMV